MTTPKPTAANLAATIAATYLAKLDSQLEAYITYNSLPHIPGIVKVENAAYINGLDSARALFEEVCREAGIT